MVEMEKQLLPDNEDGGRGPGRIPLNERLIFALDFPRPEEALAWVDRLGGRIGFFKVGLQLFTAAWWPVVDAIVARGHKVMLDLKFYDIPETVYQAVRQLREHGVSLATVHGNPPIIEAAVAAGGELRILAVTVLTSFGEEELAGMGWRGTAAELVLLRARAAVAAGCAGVVASAREAALLRRELGHDFLVVTPGIRPAEPDGADDQRRVATAGAAIAAGADYLVVGRPIRTAADPLAMVAALQQEIAAALGQKGSN
jgi:orotidine-5'-phosphate decarboxylase